MLKKLALTCIVLSGSIFYSQAQQKETFLSVKGKVLSQKDSVPLSDVTVYYERLPYYDDLGLTKSASDGSFEVNLAEGVSYNFHIDGLAGFQPYQQQFDIGPDSSGPQSIVLWVEPEEEEELITLENLNFNRGSATIQPSSYQSLDDFIVYINERPDVIIQLEGHTDFAGNPEANLRLSQARVEAVAEYLSKNGLKKSRIRTKAFGGSQPLTQDRSDEGRKMNRRVEVRLIRQNQ